MTQQKEEQVQKLLDDLNILEVKARMLESQTAKGRELDESGNSLTQAAEDIRAEQLKITEKLAEMFKSNGMYQMAERIKSYNLSPENIAVCLKEIIKDISELYAKAFKLMLENMKRRKKQDEAVQKAEKQFAEGRNFKTTDRMSHVEEVGRVGSLLNERAIEKGLTRNPENVRGLKMKPLDSGDRSKSKINPNLIPKEKTEEEKERRGKNKRKSSKLIYVKSSEARAKDLASQRALKKSEMTMTKGVSAMAPTQMSRG